LVVDNPFDEGTPPEIDGHTWTYTPASGSERHPRPSRVNNCTAAGAEIVYSIPDGPFIESIVEFFGGVCGVYNPNDWVYYAKCW
jgi:hypothetical protein